MRLNRSQFTQLKEALLGAFSTRESLEPLAREARGRSLDQLALGGSLEAIVERLISRAEEELWLMDLVTAARRLRSQDLFLQQCQQMLQPQALPANVDHCDALLLLGGRALVDRRPLRDALRSMRSGSGRSILVVDGPERSGKSYSLQLITYLRQNNGNFPLAFVDLARTAAAAGDGQVHPEKVGASIAAQLRLTGLPPRQEQEPDAAWVARFCDWLTGELAPLATMPWIVLDSFNKVLLSQGVRDLVDELGFRAGMNLMNLRLVLLGYDRYPELQSQIAGGAEYEYIEPLAQEHLIDFFIDAYEIRKSRTGAGYAPEDISRSVESVLSAVQPDDPRRLERVGDAVAREVQKVVV